MHWMESKNIACFSCKRQSRENPAPNGYTEERREEIMRAYQERSSLRGLTRTFKVAHNTVKGWLKKSWMEKRAWGTPNKKRYSVLFHVRHKPSFPFSKKKAATPPIEGDIDYTRCKWPRCGDIRIGWIMVICIKEVTKVRIWIAFCRKTRQVVARAIRDRSEKTCCEL